MTTLAELKAGAVLPPPVYVKKPYIILSEDDVVLASGPLSYIMRLSSYYDECKVEVRQHDLYLNDNTKLPVARPAPRGLSAGELIAKLKKLPASAHVILSSDQEGNDFGLCYKVKVEDGCVFLYPARDSVEIV